MRSSFLCYTLENLTYEGCFHGMEKKTVQHY